MEAVKRAIKNPQSSRFAQDTSESFTSASTPEGAMGRIALPPLALNGDDELSLSQSMFDALNIGTEIGPSTILPSDVQHADDQISVIADDRGEDLEALRSGLRFVLQCYDDLKKQERENRGMKDAILNSVVTEAHKFKGPNEKNSTLKPDGASTAVQRINHQRMRTGSILKALARGKTNAALSGVKGGGGNSAWKNGVKSPARATQMDFDAEPANLIGPSNRLGMATSHSWQQTASSSSYLDQHQQQHSGSLSPNSGARTRSLTAASAPAGVQSSSDEVQELQRKLAVSDDEKKRLMSEMESLSEELFQQANEMVKQERIKSSALEKEFDSLKKAMAAAKAKEKGIGQDTVAAVSSNAFNPDADGAASDQESMMLAAIAQASRECAEAEEEVAEWRTHCEELQTRCTILEEALYNTMSLLAEHGDEHGVAEHEAATDVMPHREYAESNASFYSVDEASSSRNEVDEVDDNDDDDDDDDDDNISAVRDAHSSTQNTSFTSNASDTSASGVLLAERKHGARSPSIGRPVSFANTEEGSVDSSYSHPSSFSAHLSAASRRTSVISSRRQSRQISLPPRRPEPSSPLPCTPPAEGADGAHFNAQQRRKSIAVVSGRARGNSLGESKLRNSYTTNLNRDVLDAEMTKRSSSIVPTTASTPANVLTTSFPADDAFSPKNTSAPFVQKPPHDEAESTLSSQSNVWDEARTPADPALSSFLALPLGQARGATELGRRHSLACSTRSTDSKMSSSSSLGANISQLSRSGSKALKGLRMLGSGENSNKGAEANKSYIPVKSVGRKMSSPGNSSKQDGHVDVAAARRQSAGNTSSSATSKKSAKSAILGHMPPAIPRGRSVASIASGSVDADSMNSDEQRSTKHQQKTAQISPTQEHYIRFASAQHASPNNESKAFSRRRRFNEIKQQQLDTDDDLPAQMY
jgi:hypothetical protein